MYHPLKRLVDIVGSLIGIVLFSPFFLVISLFIYFVSPGPVLADIPDRVGKNRKMFRFYKFRTMIPNAHQYLLDNPKFFEAYKKNNYKLDNDPRWIRGARVLRRYSLDELPQFFNVLRGDMSMVGPRAYYAFELEGQQKVYPDSRKYVKKLLTVKPGITGPWQVGGRSELTFLERSKIDAKYAENRSLLYDLAIIAKTPFAMLSGKGAV